MTDARAGVRAGRADRHHQRQKMMLFQRELQHRHVGPRVDQCPGRERAVVEAAFGVDWHRNARALGRRTHALGDLRCEIISTAFGVVPTRLGISCSAASKWSQAPCIGSFIHGHGPPPCAMK